MTEPKIEVTVRATLSMGNHSAVLSANKIEVSELGPRGGNGPTLCFTWESWTVLAEAIAALHARMSTMPTKLLEGPRG